MGIDLKRRTTLLELVINAGILRECPYHSSSFMLADKNIQIAYDHAMARYVLGDLKDLFDTSDQLINSIKKIVSVNGANECYSCRL